MSQATSLLANCTCLRIPKSWFSAPVFHPDREGVVGIFAAVAAGFLLRNRYIKYRSRIIRK